MRIRAWKWIVAGSGLLAVGCTDVSEVDCDNVTATQTIRITDSGFVPATVIINDNDVVRWVNDTSSTQNVIGREVGDDDIEFDSPNLAPGQDFCARFQNDNERYTVLSTFNPSVLSGATITVRDD